MSHARLDLKPLLFSAVLVLPLLALFAAIDWFSGWTPWPVPLVFITLAFFSARGLTRRASPATRRALLMIVVLVFLGVWKLPWNTRKPFLQDFYSLETGMTEADVERIMGKYRKGTGWPANPLTPDGTPAAPGSDSTYGHAAGTHHELQLSDALVYRHTDEAWGNSDWGVVKLKNGRVESLEFLHD